MARLILSLVCLLLAQNSFAELVRYTEDESGDGLIPLGFPVPMPVNSMSRFDGFRDYDSLINGLTILAASEDAFNRHELGLSHKRTPIFAFLFGRQIGDQRNAMLQVGGVHAREWASPETVTHIAEQLVAGMQEHGLERYLADHCSILLAPVMNPDAFQSSQQHAEQTIVGISPDGVQQTPRDGRQRRKNLNRADGQLESSEDALLGVDLNRNIGPFWQTASQSSDHAEAITYRGEHEGSEAETAALKQAAELLGGENLSLFIDTHSFGRVYFYNRTNNTRLDELSGELARLIARVPGQNYQVIQEDPQQLGYGSSDEYFAYEYAIPAFTLEIEPGTQQAAEYGGNAVSHSGFILPESQIARVRDEIFAMALLAYYHQAGPPILQSLSVREISSGELHYLARWENDAEGRRLQIIENQVLTSSQRYQLTLQFDKPMRWAGQSGQATNYPGQTITLRPLLALKGDAGTQSELGSSNGYWHDGSYELDSYSLDFSPSRSLGDQALLQISVQDLSGHALDADPASTARWNAGQWEDYDNASNNGSAEDSAFCLRLSPQASGACQNPPAPGGGGSGNPGAWFFLFLLRRAGKRWSR